MAMMMIGVSLSELQATAASHRQALEVAKRARDELQKTVDSLKTELTRWEDMRERQAALWTQLQATIVPQRRQLDDINTRLERIEQTFAKLDNMLSAPDLKQDKRIETEAKVRNLLNEKNNWLHNRDALTAEMNNNNAAQEVAAAERANADAQVSALNARIQGAALALKTREASVKKLEGDVERAEKAVARERDQYAKAAARERDQSAKAAARERDRSANPKKSTPASSKRPSTTNSHMPPPTRWPEWPSEWRSEYAHGRGKHQSTYKALTNTGSTRDAATTARVATAAIFQYDVNAVWLWLPDMLRRPGAMDEPTRITIGNALTTSLHHIAETAADAGVRTLANLYVNGVYTWLTSSPDSVSFMTLDPRATGGQMTAWHYQTSAETDGGVLRPSGINEGHAPALAALATALGDIMLA